MNELTRLDYFLYAAIGGGFADEGYRDKVAYFPRLTDPRLRAEKPPAGVRTAKVKLISAHSQKPDSPEPIPHCLLSRSV